ncbi:short-chain alcohol dehydrogenase [Taxawa tesnikishii (nom. ined.)]|nr:short-chain alcohol dehydrogenase [Dothideales sp. JES 119]
MAREDRLDVLTNNAGVLRPASAAAPAQGFEAQLATNALEDFCFGSPRFITRELGGISLGIDLHSPTPEGMTFDAATGAPVRHAGRMRNYGQSRIANGLPDSELVRRYPPSPSKIVTNV